MSDYKPVPVEAAREIAEKYDKSIVIIFSHDPVHALMHTTTYGTNPQNKELKADFEDYRLDQARKLLASLRTARAYIGGDGSKNETLRRIDETIETAARFLK
jgi:hypothetical protein